MGVRARRSGRAGLKMKPAIQLFQKRAWAEHGLIGLEPVFTRSGRVGLEAGHGFQAFWRPLNTSTRPRIFSF